jgi:hypothetical protein
MDGFTTILRSARGLDRIDRSSLRSRNPSPTSRDQINATRARRTSPTWRFTAILQGIFSRFGSSREAMNISSEFRPINQETPRRDGWLSEGLLDVFGLNFAPDAELHRQEHHDAKPIEEQPPIPHCDYHRTSRASVPNYVVQLRGGPLMAWRLSQRDQGQKTPHKIKHLHRHRHLHLHLLRTYHFIDPPPVSTREKTARWKTELIHTMPFTIMSSVPCRMRFTR